MILCLVVEAIVILTLIVIIGWNKGVGDWMESLQRPVVRKLERYQQSLRSADAGKRRKDHRKYEGR